MTRFLAKPLRLFLVVLVAGMAQPVSAADTNVVNAHVGVTTDIDPENSVGFRKGSLIVAPIPFSNPLIGSGLALGAGYLFTATEGADTSLIGAGAMRSENGSEATGATLKLSLGGGAWDVAATVADAALNYDLLAGPFAIPIRQTGTFARLQFGHQIAPNLSLGLVTKYLQTDISSGNPAFASLGSNFTLNGGLRMAGLGLTAEYDTRDSDIYPTRGTHATATILHNQVETGTVTDYTKATALLSQFHSIGERSVLGLRLAGCSTERSAPFFDLCSIGGTDSMRGFNPTQYLDANLLSVQAELRHMFTNRIGMVAFAGAGSVGTGFDSLTRGGAAGGLGLRIRVSRKVPVSFAIDMSYNDQGESLLYISVGERF